MGETQSPNAEALNVRSEMTKHRSRTGRVIDAVGAWLARPSLFVLLLTLHLGWMVCNLGWIPGIPVWDEPPFALLSSIASVEAPFMTLLILMRQQRDARIAETREELLLEFVQHLDRELSRQGEQPPLNADGLVQHIAQELNHDEGPVGGEDKNSTGA